MASDFVEFFVQRKRGEAGVCVNVPLKQPIVLYDDAPHSPYRQAAARASRQAKRLLGLHPCTKVHAEPNDWSDGVDALTAKTLDAEQVPA